jgi:phosphatidylinositol glycan class A protein
MCKKYNNVNFLIAGDGPKRGLLEEIRERQGLHDRVTLLGSLEHSEVRDVLIQGHIFLNTSLTEAYCMAIVEAVSCGLQVVSTKVGGIPEVLPEDLIYLTEPNVPALIKGLETAIDDLKNTKVLCPYECNLRIRNYYNWENVSKRTEIVYQKVIQERGKTLQQQLWSYKSTGVWPFLLVVSLCYLMLLFYEFKIPRDYIDIAKDYNHCRKKNKEKTF